MELKRGTLELVHKQDMWWLRGKDLEKEVILEGGPYGTRFEAILVGANLALDQHLVFDGGVR
jgi:hypothetical protein